VSRPPSTPQAEPEPTPGFSIGIGIGGGGRGGRGPRRPGRVSPPPKRSGPQ
jgi:hypothetical protein